MTEKEIKLLLKLAVENSKRPLTETDKEALKQGIDEAKSVEELLMVVITATTIN